MATHSSVLAWRVPGTEEPGGLPPMGSHRVGHDWSDLAAAEETYSRVALTWKFSGCKNSNKKIVTNIKIEIQLKIKTHSSVCIYHCKKRDCLWILKVKSLRRVQLFATPWTVAYEAPLSMGFSRQECWSELPFPSPGDLPNPGIKPGSPALRVDALPSEPPGKPYTRKSQDKLKLYRGRFWGKEANNLAKSCFNPWGNN